MLLEKDLLNKRVIQYNYMYHETEVDNHPNPDILEDYVSDILIKGWSKEASKHLKIKISKDAERGTYIKSVSGVVLTPEEYKELVRMATANKG